MSFLSQGLSTLGFGHTRTMPSASSQLNEQPPSQVPATILELFIPGYSTISGFLLDAFGFDITKVVSVAFVGYALVRSVEYLQRQVVNLITNYATCHVIISSDVDSYAWIMDWLADRRVGEKSHSLMALSTSGKESLRDYFANLAENNERPSSKRKGKTEMKYEPAVGLRHYFFHHGKLFLWMRSERAAPPMANPMFYNATVDGRLYCLSRTTRPIKDLLQEVFKFNEKKTAVKTIIRRPVPEKQRNMGGNPWRKAVTRPSRSMDTVVLSDDQKEHIIKDIEEYLLAETQEWYAQRGIPYRRGYLFHGPPGTGKTSLSFALAGKFDLDVYCMSLQDPTLTEEDLAMLFDKLPEQCLVLLEDIDSAGLIARTTKPPSPKPSTDPHSSPDIPPPKRTPGEGNISLSGLLNIIDGVASHEGRVLVMTTNHIEKLDNALLRPGRIDVRVRFELATRGHAESLFMQIFGIAEMPSQSSGEEGKDRGEDVYVEKDEVVVSGNSEELSARLRTMAKEFAQDIPEKKLSPAEIQGFLINHKKSEEDAVRNVKEWVESTLKTSNRG